MSCLSEESIGLYMNGAVRGSDAEWAEAHIDQCAGCRLTIAAAARGLGASPGQAAPSSAPLTVPPSGGALAPTPALGPGDTIGRYVVRRLVGAGGMGLVYAAYDPQLDREVALKLLRPDLLPARGDLRERLLREARLMARLAHPNVLSVFDLAAIEDQICVTMELVPGQTLGQRLRAERELPWRAVLDLFLAAGRGLAAAHAAGIVHRDFKPDNVLVTEDGRVLVADFGLAHLARRGAEAGAAPGGGQPPPAHDSALLGTPAYMAPEQARGETSPRSDQYAFCVALYEGLYGERPSRDRAPAALTPGRRAAAPRTGKAPAWVRRVVLRGLAPEPEARWPSMEALLGALRDDPAVRWRRRAWAALGLLILLCGVAERRLHAQPPCQGAARRLHGVWDSARRAAVERAFSASGSAYAADAFRGVAAALDGYAAAWTAMHTDACEATWLRREQSAELLDLRMVCLDQRLGELRTLVALYERPDAVTLQHAVAAAPHLSALRPCADAHELTQPVRLPTDPAARERIRDLTQRLTDLRARHRAGHAASMLADAEALAGLAATAGHPPLHGEAQLLVGDLHQARGALPAAEAAFYQALWAGEAGKHDRLAAQAWTRLLFVVGSSPERRVESERLRQHAEAALHRLGDDEGERATLESAAGMVAYKAGAYQEALRRFETSRGLLERTQGASSVDLAEVLQRLAQALEYLGKWEESIAMGRRGLDILRQRLGETHPQVAEARQLLSKHLLFNDYVDQALLEARRALAICERVYHKDDPHIGVALAGVAGVLLELSRGREALPLLERALAIFEGPGAGLTAPVELGLALQAHSTALLQMGRAAEAVRQADRARRLFAEMDRRHPRYADALMDLGHAHRAAGAFGRALAVYRESLAVLRASQLTDAWSFARPLLYIARAHVGLGERAAARRHLTQARALLEESDPTATLLGDVYFLLAQHSAGPRSRELAERALAVYRREGVGRGPLRVEVERFLAR